MHKGVSGVAVLALAAGLCSAGDLEFFETKVRPVLATQCHACHGSKAKIVQGGLRLDTREGLMKGGHSGPAIVPGNPDESRLIQAVRHQMKPAMPPWGKLPAEQIAALEEWVRLGAPWPQETAEAVKTSPKAIDASKHWAWQPIPKAMQQPIDGFLERTWREKGLAANPPADPAVLLRRVHLDVTGLPPSPREMEAFLGDPSEAHFQRIVDSLLASPAFGERWGRHWLDITYYADTMDPNAGIPAAHAWRYRDYVIRSINADKPLDRFIVEQIAGDLLPAAAPGQRNELLAATGYLALGPWTLVQADKVQLRMDVVDGQLDGIGKGLLGLTLGCARCHDHKFDPISQREYYGLAGFFTSTRTEHGRWREAGVFSDINRVRLWESPAESAARLERAATFERALADIVHRIEDLKAKKKAAGDGDEGKKRAKDLDAEIQAFERRQGLLEFNRPQPPEAYSVQDETPADCRINIRGNAHQLGDAAPRTFVKVAMFGQAAPRFQGSGRMELARWIADSRNPLTPRVYVNRVWQNLFGVGLVKSADNFGLRGDLPSHPELLDDLAAQFLADGWSTKKLIRRIVSSRAYRMSSASQRAGMERDPENRLLWRMNPRRLEAEIIRDAVLSVTGQLDASREGPTLPTTSLDTFAPDLGKVNPPRMLTNGKLPERVRYRRTVYLPVYRPAQMDDLDLLNLFDFAYSAQVNASRRQTVVPTQSLFLLNSTWLRDQARVLGRRLLENPALVDSLRVEELIRGIYNRPVQAGEVTRALDFVYETEQALAKEKTASPALEAWTLYIQSLLASNEFLFRS